MVLNNHKVAVENRWETGSTPCDRGQLNRSRWCRGHGGTWAAQLAGCSSERSVCAGTASAGTVVPYHRASHSSQSSESASTPPEKKTRQNHSADRADFCSTITKIQVCQKNKE